MGRSLVSVVTGTIPPRLDLLIACMRNLRESTYPNLEHCIAIEGEPAEVDEMVTRVRCEAVAMGRFVPTRITPLGRWWSRFLAESMSAVPFQVAQWMARGEYLMWLADDERMEPDHIESLVELLESSDADFVYSMCDLWPHPDLGVEWGPQIIGADPPRYGQVTNTLYRAELLDYRGFVTHVGSGTDHDQVMNWVAAGARWAMLPRVTFHHRTDKLGEGPDYRIERQPLRGHHARA